TGVRLTRGPHHGGIWVVPQVEARVDRDAGTTDGDAGLVDVAVRLRVGRFNDLVDVNAVLAGEPSELMGESDVDVAVCRFGKLGEFGRLGGTEVPDSVGPGQVGALIEIEYGLVELDGALGTMSGEPSDQLRVLAKIGEHATGEYALW